MTEQSRLAPEGSPFKDPETCDGLFPRRDPQPIGGCTDCIEYAETRANARSAGDHSRASDINVLMRQHQGEARH